ncbi:MAG: 2,3,4,5-tetrahydropyridine-2,6-dicarboxylate N-succinyltransferase [Gemmatimonadetes bacterium]|nr:MAG: 2,3,4,5-tetrahydropyridine-2,6-dicarboxylate N-succinyltransferase [Gemmatimonadota bacterium]GDX88021.1 2,3,4,5-tetrahydropyridine-2,6-dicarboxylate N-succinyltransferase [Gemmatimonadota bacterium]
MTLATRIAALAAVAPGTPAPSDALTLIDELLTHLESGIIRAAERDAAGRWHAVPWVKQGILLAFRFGVIADLSASSGAFSFVDKHTMPPRRFAPEDGVRIVPGGSTVRRGAYLARGVVCMPPMFVNVGAWIGAGTMVDSHALVGSCAQVGERVHLSAAAQIGGVLEPVGASPVVIEDDVVVGGNCGVYEGTVVRARAVLGAGVVLTRGTPVFDLVKETVYRATADRPLEIPADAVVVPGARSVKGGWGAEQGLSLQTPVIVKYRDERTDLATALESWLR